MNINLYLLCSVLVTGMLCACTENSGNQNFSSQPNIIFIYADDLGYGDLGCYGADSIDTPHLDQMAVEGARFTNFYVTSPVCSPSRSSLLTGRYQVRSGVTRVFFPNSLQGLDTADYTMAEMLKENGYATALVGKWHLGHLEAFLPEKHGFDYWFGLPYSNDMTWEPRNDPPLPLMRNGVIIDQPVHQPTLTQRYTAEAINFMAINRETPFFIYLAHTFPHLPLHVSTEYKGTSKLGIYGDVVQELDRSVGEVMKAVNDLGLGSNTIIVFSSDNGPAQLGGGQTGGLRGWKATTFEGGIKVPTIAWWPGTIPPQQTINEPAIMTDWLPTFAALTGAKLPGTRVFDGQDITTLLTGNYEPQERDFYFYFNEDLRAMRSGNWKYKKAIHNNPYRQKALENHGDLLFDLKTDPNETTNLAGNNPEILKVMKEKMETFLDQLGDIPEPKLKTIPFDDPRGNN